MSILANTATEVGWCTRALLKQLIGFSVKHLEITEDLEHVVKRNVSEQIIDDVIEAIPFTDYEQKYESLKSCCLRGEFGKTPQFWMTYQKAIDRQHKFNFSINTNDFDLRLKCWKDSLPLCFATNKQNYARYGTYHITQLENIDLTHPGLKEKLQEMGLSVFSKSV